jgi:hypothetical protein
MLVATGYHFCADEFRSLGMDLLDFKEFIITGRVAFTEGRSFMACHHQTSSPHKSNKG